MLAVLAFMSNPKQLDAGADERVRHLEVGGAQQAEALACPVCSEIPCDGGCHRRVWPCMRPLLKRLTRALACLVAEQSKMAHTPPNPRCLAPSNRNVN